jgi:hypothetical protein
MTPATLISHANRNADLQVAIAEKPRSGGQDEDNDWTVVTNPTQDAPDNNQNPSIQEFSRHFDWTLRWGDWSHTVFTADLK